MSMVLTYQGLPDECLAVPSGCRASDQADRLELKARLLAFIVRIHHRRLVAVLRKS